MKKHIYISLLALVFVSLCQKVSAQGCVAVRQMGGINAVGSAGYALKKGELMVGTNYRYFHSFRHFVGTDEKPYRQNTQGGFDANGHQKGNAVNIYSHAVDFNFSYAITNRLQVNASIPFVYNERSQVLSVKTGDTVVIDNKKTPQVLDGRRYSVYAKGLGDVRFSVNYWLIDPEKAKNGNLMLGLGVKLATGHRNTKGNMLKYDKKTSTFSRVASNNDQAIQPGDGGVGFSIELQGFKKLYKGIYGFANGYYLFNPRQSNGSFKSGPDLTVKDASGKTTLDTLVGYNSFASPDQYFVRAGIMGSVLHSKLTLSLAARWEGIPAYDVFGGQHAYRRPGYVVAVEPGVTYRAGKHTFSLFVPYNFIKNRIQSANDIATQKIQNAAITESSKKVHVQGDAAFADYSINFVYNYRLPLIK